MPIKNSKLIYILALSALLILPSDFVFASETSGTIDSTDKYAWSENIGWINFACDNCNVAITDSTITGYTWSDSYGWINLNPSGSGVTNNGEGTLSGQAWGENTGWINFSGVTIDSSGYFNGYANGTITGQISFNCSNTNSCGSSDFKVRTDWRPASARTSSEQTTTGGGGGGGVIPGTFDNPSAPLGVFKVVINNGAYITDSRTVNLSFNAGSNVKKIAISNTDDFKDASQEPYTPTKEWDLCSKFGGLVKLQDCDFGKRSVYVKFYTKFGRPSQVFSDSIVYKKTSGKISGQEHYAPLMNFNRNLRLGDTGEDVKALQQFLNQIDDFRLADSGPGSPGNETEYFGSLTFNALKKFQQAHKEQILKPIKLAAATGFFGPSTRSFVNSFANVPRQNQPSTDSDPINPVLSDIFTKTLRLGMQSNDIKRLQQLLNLDTDTKLSDQGSGSPDNETTYFGLLTRDAVKRFQKKYNIVYSGDERTTGYGLVGPRTRAKLNEILKSE